MMPALGNSSNTFGSATTRKHSAAPRQKDRSRGPNTRPAGSDFKLHQRRHQARRRLRITSARLAKAATPGAGTKIAVPSEPMLPNAYADLSILLNAWGSCPAGTTGCAGDINDDGRVDGVDLGELLNGWGTCPL